MSRPILSVRNLNASFRVKGKNFHVIRNISFDIYPGETIGLVGESGCGKTTLGKILLGLVSYDSGTIEYKDENLSKMSHLQLTQLRKECQMIFQDPYGSVNPRMTIEEIIAEPLIIHKMANKQERKEKVKKLLELVGLDSSFIQRYPHELSGGQRQRVVIARALALEPKFIICDEPIAALDVSIQAQIINLLRDLQKKLGLTYLFISHDLAVVKYLATRTMVMYSGEIVESAESKMLYKHPLHPYTQALLNSIPTIDPTTQKKRLSLLLSFEPPNLFEEIKGCPFASRCPKKLDHCTDKTPLINSPEEKHCVKCHLYNQKNSTQSNENVEKELIYSEHYI